MSLPMVFPLPIVLNPQSGKKRAQEQFTSIIKPALEQSQKPFQVVETTSKEHAFDYFKQNMQSLLWDYALALNTESTEPENELLFVENPLPIMVIGGDGTVHEIVNGILASLYGPHEQQFKGPQPCVELSIIPSGTGNSIATSLGITSVQDALDRFFAGSTRGLRVMSVSTRSDHSLLFSGSSNLSPISSPLSSSSPPSPIPFQEWNIKVHTVVVNSFGLHAATVYEAEGFRSLGNDRFKMSGLKNIVMLQQYPGTLELMGSFQRYDRELREFQPVPAENGNDNEALLHLPGPFTYLVIAKQASLEPGFMPTPLANTSDEWLDVLVVQNVGRLAILKILGGAGKNGGEHIQDARVQYFKTKAVELEAVQGGRLCVDGEFLEIGAGPRGRVRIEVVAEERKQLFRVFG
ncbi:hypothetical protein BG004_007628 [Podila humilis]|nr:hypothetical protein BG004_007628 [Podila humilis]